MELREALSSSHPFSAEELAANRAGRVHPAQLARHQQRLDQHLAKMASTFRTCCLLALLFQLVPTAFVVVVILAKGAGGVDPSPVIAQTLLAGFAVALVPGLVAWIARRTVKNTATTLDPTLKCAQGPVMKQRFSSRGGPVWRLEIGDYTLTVPRGAWEEITGGVMLRAYFLPGSLALEGQGFLSAEAVA